MKIGREVKKVMEKKGNERTDLIYGFTCNIVSKIFTGIIQGNLDYRSCSC